MFSFLHLPFASEIPPAVSCAFEQYFHLQVFVYGLQALLIYPELLCILPDPNRGKSLVNSLNYSNKKISLVN